MCREAVPIRPNGIGKSTIAHNVAYQALCAGHNFLFLTAGALIGELTTIDSASTLHRGLRHYASFALLCIDEVGYLSYSNRHADPLPSDHVIGVFCNAAARLRGRADDADCSAS